jgi:hypothetical protein
VHLTDVTVECRPRPKPHVHLLVDVTEREA